MYCHQCGAEINPNAVVCLKCGVAVAPAAFQSTTNEKWTVVLLLCLLLGFLGAHNFYLGKTRIGVFQLLCGLLTCFIGSGIWATIDLCRIIAEDYQDADGTILRRFRS